MKVAPVLSYPTLSLRLNTPAQCTVFRLSLWLVMLKLCSFYPPSDSIQYNTPIHQLNVLYSDLVFSLACRAQALYTGCMYCILQPMYMHLYIYIYTPNPTQLMSPYTLDRDSAQPCLTCPARSNVPFLSRTCPILSSQQT